MSFFLRILSFILLLSFLLPNTASSQNRKLKKYYQNKLEPNSTLLDVGGIFTFEKTSENEYIRKDYYYDTKQITHLYTYKSKNFEKLNGPCAEYYDDGSLIFKGNYFNGKRSGKWITEKGRTSGSFENGLEEGDWTTTDSLGNVIKIFPFVNGKIHGTGKIFNANGDLIRTELYEDDEFISEEILIKNNSKLPPENFKVVEVMPEFPGCESEPDSTRRTCAQRKMLMHVYSSLRYPPMAREMGIEGKAVVRFVVGKEGDVENIEVLRGLCNDIREQCLKVVKTMPRWNPGLQNGEPVKVYFTLPLSFRLE